jgi:type VI secretion system secreted protein VgrG
VQAGILGSADDFAVLGGSTVTNTGLSLITGDLGVSPGTAVTGISSGVIHSSDAVALQAQVDMMKAYNGLSVMSVTSNLTGQDLGGLTLTSGVYHFDTTAQLTGALTLDAQGQNDAYWVFQIGTALTTASLSSVNVINAGSNTGKDDGIFWQVGSSATLGTFTEFEGNILALTSITMNTDATDLNGRMLAHNGAVTLDTNTVGINGGPGYNGGLTYATDGNTIVPAVVPEPSALLLLAAGSAMFLFGRKFRPAI